MAAGLCYGQEGLSLGAAAWTLVLLCKGLQDGSFGLGACSPRPVDG